MGDYSSKLYADVKRYLKKENVDFEEDKKDGDFRFTLGIENKIESVESIITILDDGISFLSVAPFRAEPKLYAAVVQYITRANFIMSGCNFIMSYDDGRIMLRSGTFCSYETISHECLDDIVGFTEVYWKMYGNGLLKVLFENANPKETIEKIKNK
ncbi:MAG: hypothetical protein LBT20_08865 [Clostridiales bacterium]|jgi:hypothetical protein|nr:hypothetical protein [Clostridiales bacterium]